MAEAGGAGDGDGGPLLCLENMDAGATKLCRTEEEIAPLLDRFPRLRLTCDLAHLGQNGLDADRFVRRFAEQIIHFHASGVRPGRSHKDVSLAESDTDIRLVLGRYRDRDIAVCLENQSVELALASKAVLESVRAG